MTDLQIIDLYFARSETAIHETNVKYGRLCTGVAANVLHDHSDVEECVNDTWLTAWNTIPPTRPNKFSAFLCAITRRLSLKRLEYNTAARRKNSLQVSFMELENALPDHRFSPDTGEEELGEMISRFLLTEREEARMAFLRRYWFFDSVEEIAHRFGWSQSKVKSMLMRTREKLRKYLEQEGVFV